METQNKSIDPTRQASKPEEDHSMHNRKGRVLGGLIIVAVGALLLARQLGVSLPWWLFSWQMLLIALGFYIGARHSFRNWVWLIPVAIGTIFFTDYFIDDISLRKLFWPLLIIVVGLVMMLKPRRQRHHSGHWKRWEESHAADVQESSDDYLDHVTIFGGVKKNVISKNFRGGELVTMLGGTELNLLQADASGKMVLDLVQIFGGTKLIVPAHWKIQTDELVCIFGGLDDKRGLPAPSSAEPTKVLIIKGTCIFGGIDIKSY